MAEDLGRIVSGLHMQNRDGPRSKWAPGSWAMAAEPNASKRLGKRFPVIISADSLVRTPDDLRKFCHLQSVPPVAQTTKTALLPLADEKSGEEKDPKSFRVSEVDRRRFLDLQKRTEGDLICVWFHRERRYAWLTRSLKKEEGEVKDGVQQLGGSEF